MALSHGRSMQLWVSTPSAGASAILTQTKEVNGLPGDVDLGDVTAAGQVGHTSYPGLQKSSFSSVHNLDQISTGTLCWDVLSNFQTLQQTYPTVPWGITFYPNGTTAGKPRITCNVWIKSLALPLKATDPNTFTVNWEMSAGTSGMTIATVSV